MAVEEADSGNMYLCLCLDEVSLDRGCRVGGGESPRWRFVYRPMVVRYLLVLQSRKKIEEAGVA